MEQDGIYYNLLMEENDSTTTNHNLLTQSRIKKGSEFTASTNDKIWSKTVFRHSLRRCILVRGYLEIKVLCEQTREVNKLVKRFFGSCLILSGLGNIVVDFHF